MKVASRIEIGILAYGSLLNDPGAEIEAIRIGEISPVQTPFSVEFARTSRTRGGAPTLVPVTVGGAQVRGTIILVNATLPDAIDILYRREIHRTGSTKTYKEPPPEASDRVRVKELRGFHGVSTVIYTGLASNMNEVSAEKLAQCAIESVAKAPEGKDGISYLIGAIEHGIQTALSDEYAAEILRRTGANALDEALAALRNG